MRAALIPLPILLASGCVSDNKLGHNDPGLGAGDTGIAPTNVTNPTTGTTFTFGTGSGGTGTGAATGSGGTGTGTATGNGTATGTGTGTGGNPRDPTEVVDDAIQPASFLVDVLWVVDNSCSMSDDQASLTTNFPSFMDYFDNVVGIDYHIGVISTDMDSSSHQGRLRADGSDLWIDVNTPDKHTTFNNMALMGTTGSGTEQGLATTNEALTTHLNGHNAGFIRSDASLAILVISDENDYSAGFDTNQFITDLQNFKPDPSLVTFSAIMGDVPGGCASAEAGTGYDPVIQATAGVFHSICAANWDTVLQSLAASALGNRMEFFLSEIPDENTIEVEVVESNGTITWYYLGTDFTYDAARNSVTFIAYIPPPDAAVYVHYQPLFGAGW